MIFAYSCGAALLIGGFLWLIIPNEKKEEKDEFFTKTEAEKKKEQSEALVRCKEDDPQQFNEIMELVEKSKDFQLLS